MKRLLLACLLLPLAALAETAGRPVHIVLVGDSTVTDLQGWGLGFRQFAGDGVVVSNAAKNGRSSKSYRDEGLWDQALALKGDYYLIQFGHNDQPGKGPERETDPATTFPQNMARYVDEVRALGATPILVTSLTRRNFSKTDPGHIESTLVPHVEAVKRVAAEKNVPLIDLHARSIALCESLGPARTAGFNFTDKTGKTDTTHLRARGSGVFAGLVVDELRRAVPALAPVLLAEPRAAKLSDLEYGNARGEKLLLDVSVPAGEGPFPVAILVHGGGWSRGDKFQVPAGDGADITPWFAPLTAAKFTWFSINYRHAPQHRWPACFEDVQTAIRWVKAHAAEYQGDPNRIVLVGHSAGGHLACLAAVRADADTRVQAVVGYAPVTDQVKDSARRNGLSPALQRLLNRPNLIDDESARLLREISANTYIKPGLPPFFLIHGTADKSVPYDQSPAFQEQLRAAGVECELVTIPDAPHAFGTWINLASDYQQRMFTWLQTKLEAGAKTP